MTEKRFELDWEDEEVCNFYAKRCRECCIHYDDVVADCYLGNNIYEKCECYEPKIDKDDVMTEKEVLDALNYLHKENKQLKKRLMICQDKVKGLMK